MVRSGTTATDLTAAKVDATAMTAAGPGGAMGGPGATGTERRGAVEARAAVRLNVWEPCPDIAVVSVEVVT